MRSAARHFARPAAPPPRPEPPRVLRASAHGSVQLQIRPTPQKSQKQAAVRGRGIDLGPWPVTTFNPPPAGARSRPVLPGAGDSARADRASTPPAYPLGAGPLDMLPARDARHGDQRHNLRRCALEPLYGKEGISLQIEALRPIRF